MSPPSGSRRDSTHALSVHDQPPAAGAPDSFGPLPAAASAVGPFYLHRQAKGLSERGLEMLAVSLLLRRRGRSQRFK